MPFHIEEVAGDIVGFEADFVVNASNTKLILGSGVSMALRRHCGYALQEAMDVAKQKASRDGLIIEQGDVLMTTAAKAGNFKYVLHAAVMNYHHGTNPTKQPTVATIDTILHHCMPYFSWYAKEHDKTMTAIFPYLGCGVGGLDKGDVKRIFQAVFNREVSYQCNIKLCSFL